MAAHIEPAALLARLLDELDKLPTPAHLAALEALNRHDFDLVFADPHTINVVIGPCTVQVPLADLSVDLPAEREPEPLG